MNWSKAKTILIYFMLVANLFLAFILIRSSCNSTYIPKETIANTVSLLSERGVSIDSSLIPNKIENAQIYTVKNAMNDYADFATKVLGENYLQSDNLYYTDIASVTFSGDKFEIKYSDTSFQADGATPAEISRNYLSNLGIDTNNASENIQENGNETLVTFSDTLEKMQFYAKTITVKLIDNRICEVSGSWFYQTDEKPTQLTLQSVPSLLIKYSSDNPAFTNIEISAIELGYGMGEPDVFHKSSTILPVYKVSCTNGAIFYIDAV